MPSKIQSLSVGFEPLEYRSSEKRTYLNLDSPPIPNPSYGAPAGTRGISLGLLEDQVVVRELQSLLALLRWQGLETVVVQSGSLLHAAASSASSLHEAVTQQDPRGDKFGEVQQSNTFFLAP